MSAMWQKVGLTGLTRGSCGLCALKPRQATQVFLVRSVYRPVALAPVPKPQPLAIEQVPGFGVFSPTVCKFIAERNYENEHSDLEAWVMSLTEENMLGIVKLNQFVFGTNPRIDILHRVVVWQRAKSRAGTACVKTKDEVRGGGRKPWPQKKLGKARQGSIRSPHFIGGGVVHGPKPKSYEYTLPKKVRRMGLRVALSVRYAQGDLHIVDTFENVEDEKELIPVLEKQGWTSAVLVDSKKNPRLKRAAIELEKVDVLHSKNLSVYPMLRRHNIILSLEAVRQLEDRLCEDDRIITNQFV